MEHLGAAGERLFRWSSSACKTVDACTEHAGEIERATADPLRLLQRPGRAPIHRPDSLLVRRGRAAGDGDEQRAMIVNGVVVHECGDPVRTGLNQLVFVSV